MLLFPERFQFLLQTGDSERALSEGLTAIQGAMAELEEAEKKLSRFLKLRTGVQDGVFVVFVMNLYI